ncbi:MAG: SAM-dependent methyltransferase, partial [Eubacteriales bacterium]
YSYIQDMVEAAGYEAKMIPGVTSFCAVAAALGTSLTTMHQPIHIYPGGDTATALTHPGTKVLMKTGKAMVDARTAIVEAGLEKKTMLVQNCGLPTEQIHHNLADASNDISYFTTIIVKD